MIEVNSLSGYFDIVFYDKLKSVVRFFFIIVSNNNARFYKIRIGGFKISCDTKRKNFGIAIYFHKKRAIWTKKDTA